MVKYGLFAWLICVGEGVSLCKVCARSLGPTDFVPKNRLQRVNSGERVKSNQLVYCPQNCGALVNITALNEHFDVCAKWNVRCECGATMKRAELPAHTQVCPKLEKECEVRLLYCRIPVFVLMIDSMHLGDALQRFLQINTLNTCRTISTHTWLL
jgi:hypothetical protein